MKRSISGTIFDYCNYILLFLLSVSILLPFITLLSVSFSAKGSMAGLQLLPKQWSLVNYTQITQAKFIWVGYYNTIFRTVLGTFSSVLITSIAAYCLSKPYFPNRTFWTGFVVFTMFFSGGLIPSYLLITGLGLSDNPLVLILPGLIGTYNMIIIRNFFQQLPAELEESAKLDGAGNLRILFSIIYPISLPVLATVALWVAVGHWNAWFDCLVYIRDTNKFVLQIVLRRIVLQGTQQMMEMVGEGVKEDTAANPDGLKAAAIFVSTVPILCVYPFIQKYFVKGIMVGSLKG